jgi:hypothetical protein
MSPRERHVSWANLSRSISAGTPQRFVLKGPPQLDLLLDSSGSSLGLALPFPQETSIPLSPLSLVNISRRTVDGNHLLYISTGVRRLYREFYELLMQIADYVQLDELDATSAFTKALEKWKSLLEEVSPLSTESQLGLLGELWLLVRLLNAKGSLGFDSWTGPLGEPHDFRFGGFEIEVKTTSSRRHGHFFTSLDQLSPSLNARLFVLSLLAEPAGQDGGQTLSTAIALVRQRLSNDPNRLTQFNSILATELGYDDETSQHYTARYQLRSEPVIIEVNDEFPRITRSMIEREMGGLSHRIVECQYFADLENLGNPLGDAAAKEIVPGPVGEDLF